MDHPGLLGRKPRDEGLAINKRKKVTGLGSAEMCKAAHLDLESGALEYGASHAGF